MGFTVDARATRIVGRAREQLLLGEAVEGAAAGGPCAVFVHGEAGVGKTALVTQVCADAGARGFSVLWGRCVHFAAASSPYAPVLGALEGWQHAAAAGDGVAELFATVRDDEGADSRGRMLQRLERVLTHLATQTPTILVIDDLQWADVTSLDLLAYLVTGFHSQQLALVVTYRDEQLDDGHPLHGWLADLTRLPAVHDLPLERLSEQETAEQLALLVGSPPHDGLVRQVQARSGGNAYLTELLAQNLTPGAQKLPRGLPDRLRGVLLATWHGLSSHTREVMRLLAVGGEPFAYAELLDVAERLGLDPAHVAAALAEATAAGVVRAEGTERYWFRHPLLAEVLYDSFLPGEAARFHAAYVAVLESATARDEVDRIRHLSVLALHHEGSGNPEAAFGYLIQAAGRARRVQGYPEEANHLYRAVQLTDKVSHQTLQRAGGTILLLERTAQAARHCGDVDVAYDLVSRALRRVNRSAQPLAASRLLLMWSELVFHSGRVAVMPIAQVMEAVQLSEARPDSEEHARALAELSKTEAWLGMSAPAAVHADAAVAAARRSGSQAAMSLALGARSFSHIREDRAARDAEGSYRCARRSGDPTLLAQACIDRMNSMAARGRLREQLSIGAEGFAVTTAAGVRDFAAMFAGTTALTLLQLGRLTESREWVREALAARATGSGAVFAWRAAATLAMRSGRMAEAEGHIRRLEELMPAFVDQVGLEAPRTMAEYHLASGTPSEALRVAERALPVHGVVDDRLADELLVWGARAAADVVRRSNDRFHAPEGAQARAALDQLVAVREALPVPPFTSIDAADAVQPAYRALFRAETGRCMGDPDERLLWEAAVDACRSAEMRWEQAMAEWRLAQTLVGAKRGSLAAALRSAHALATEIEAMPLREEVEALARSTRVSLEQPSMPEQRPGSTSGLGLLTRRELEVLGHLVAGRSYGEIAEALFISQKTVSVHVSNLLRKTGTRNRVEAAALARRQGVGQQG